MYVTSYFAATIIAMECPF